MEMHLTDTHYWCQQYPDIIKYVNMCDYTLSDVLLILAGTIFWNVVYYFIIRNAFKHKFVEMPVAAGASNLAWEFVWGFMVTTDLGAVFVWGLRIWFFLDLFIFYTILKYGAKQLSTPLFKNNFKWWEITVALLWVPAFYLFYTEGYDTSMGATSAYMITVIMAFLYVWTYASAGSNQQYFSGRAAWCKGIGNTLMSIFVFMHYPEMKFLQLLTVVVFLLNVGYIVLVTRQRLKEMPVKDLVKGRRTVEEVA